MKNRCDRYNRCELLSIFYKSLKTKKNQKPSPVRSKNIKQMFTPIEEQWQPSNAIYLDYLS